MLLLALSGSALAQERFTATVDRTTVRVGETITLTLTFEGASGVPTPELPSLGNLQLVGGPYTSTSMSIVNGRMSSTASFSYALRAKQPGSAQIGTASVAVKGKIYTTQPLHINVLASGARSPDAQKGGGSETADVFMRAFADKKEAYVGEQITVSYKIYFAVQMTNPEMVRLPQAAGFWVEDIPLPGRIVLSDEIVGGRAYKAAVIRKSALFPTTDGELEVEPLVVKTKIERRVSRRPRDPFDIFNDPFFQLGREWEEVQVESPGLKLKVKPLPQSGAPADFSGAVGNFRVRASLDRETCATNEGVTLTVQVEGTGNIKTLPPPRVEVPKDVQRFDPEVTDAVNRSRQLIGGSKTLKYVLIPRAPGLQVIPGLRYSCFDPQSGKYATLTTPDMALRVEKGQGTFPSQSGVAVASKQGVENIATDIAFAKTRPGRLISSLGTPHESPLFWIGVTAPWLGLAGVMIVVGRRRGLQDERTLRRAALRRAMKELERAEKMPKSAKPEAGAQHVSSAVDDLLQAAGGSGAAGMTSAELAELWQRHELDSALLEQLLEMRSECDGLRFAAGHSTPEIVRGLVLRGRRVADAIARGRAGGSTQ